MDLEKEFTEVANTYIISGLALIALLEEYKVNPTEDLRKTLLLVALLADLATWGFSADYFEEFNNLDKDNNKDD